MLLSSYLILIIHHYLLYLLIRLLVHSELYLCIINIPEEEDIPEGVHLIWISQDISVNRIQNSIRLKIVKIVLAGVQTHNLSH